MKEGNRFMPEPGSSRLTFQNRWKIIRRAVNEMFYKIVVHRIHYDSGGSPTTKVPCDARTLARASATHADPKKTISRRRFHEARVQIRKAGPDSTSNEGTLDAVSFSDAIIGESNYFNFP